MGRLTHLDVTDLTIFSAGDYMGLFRSLDFDWEVLTDPGRAVAQRYQQAIPKKKRLTWTMEEMITASAARQTNLNITIFTVGGTAYLGRLKSGSLKISTDNKDGSGAADLWEYPYAMGTDWEINGSLQVATTAAFAAIIGAAGTSGLAVTVSVAFGGWAFIGPGTLTMSKHSIKEGDFQIEDVTLKCKGTITTAAVTGASSSLLNLIALGSSQITWSATTGAISPSGIALVTELNGTFNDAALLTASYSMANQGAPTLS